jgi:single-strand DNA-binding protein
VNRAYSKGGERQADFFDVVAWRSNAEFISRYFVKGSAILIEGTMESRSFEDKSGQKRRAWEVIAENARFVEGKAERSAQEAIPAQTSALGDFTEIDDDDDLF